jgi:hypothetical protein
VRLYVSPKSIQSHEKSTKLHNSNQVIFTQPMLCHFGTQDLENGFGETKFSFELEYSLFIML